MGLQITSEFQFAKQITRQFIYVATFMAIIAAAWMSVLLSNASALDGTSFITTWKTDNPGTSSETSIRIPVNRWEATYNYDVDWDNDGVFDEFGITGEATHDYGVSGTYTIRIQGDFPRMNLYGSGESHKIINIDQWGTNEWDSMSYAFAGAENLTSTAIDAPNLTSVTDMNSMFLEARLFNQDLTNWDVSNVTIMEGLFSGATAFQGDISNWDVSNVTDMSFMFGYFNGGELSSTFNGDISNWDVSNVTDMSGMFYRANIFNSDISDWDVSSVTNMNSMFGHAYAFNSDISNWDVSNVTGMAAMFGDGNYGGEVSAFNSDISDWDVSNVTIMNGMFYNSESFNSDISNWDVSNVTNMNEMFSGATAFNSDISNWDVSNVTNMSRMFRYVTNFSADLSFWDVSNVTDMSNMFEGASVFNSNLSSWDVGNVTDMNAMFGWAQAFNSDISAWDISNVTGMHSMLNYTALTVANYDALLDAWSKQQVQPSVVFHASPTKYCTSEPARALLIENKGWSITDGGQCVTPVVASISPSEVIVNESDKKITISGSGFQYGVSVTIGGEEATIDSYEWQGTSMVVVVPVSTATKSVDIVVMNPEGTSTTVVNGLTYIAKPAPAISSTSEQYIEVGASVDMYIGGINFGAGAGNPPTVTINGGTATIIEWHNTYVLVSVPVSTVAGPAIITVTNPDGQSATSSSLMSYYEAPEKNVSSVYIDDRDGSKYLVIEGESFLRDDEFIDLAFLRSLVTLNDRELPFCNPYATMGLNAQQFIDMVAQEDDIDIDPSLISDTPLCYEIIDFNLGRPVFTDSYASIWLPEGYDTDAMGTVSVNGSPIYAFNTADEDEPVMPTVRINGTAPLDQHPHIAKRPTFNGVATPGATITVTVHSDPISCTATADQSGNWSCTLPADLEEGEHTVYVRVVNPDSSVQELGPYAVTVTADESGGTVTNNDTPGVPNTGFLTKHAAIIKQFQAEQKSKAIATSAVLGAGASLLLAGIFFGSKAVSRRIVQSVKK